MLSPTQIIRADGNLTEFNLVQNIQTT